MKVVANILILLFSIPIFGQDVVLDDFSVFSNQDQVHLSWTFKAGSLCSGIIIKRSADSLNFDVIGEIPGVCGDINSPVSFSFIDSTALLNHHYFYRLDFGGFSFSQIISHWHYGSGVRSSIVFPNPIDESSLIVLNQQQIANGFIEVYHADGRLISKEMLIDYPVKVSQFVARPGNYFYRIILEDGIRYHGRFIKL